MADVGELVMYRIVLSVENSVIRFIYDRPPKVEIMGRYAKAIGLKPAIFHCEKFTPTAKGALAA